MASGSSPLTKNFKSTEFDCKGKGCCNKTLIEAQLVEKLQKIRDHFGAAVIINSGYRCSKHNRAVGGVVNSKHLTGMAADIIVRGISPKDVAAYADKIGFKGIGLYKTFTHVDTRKTKARW